MDSMEDKITSMLNDPEMMEKIMSMAKNLGMDPGGGVPDVDPAMLQKLSGFAGRGTIDPQQRSLLQALNPYLSNHRIQKLEKAMRAAKMAKFAVAALGNAGVNLSTGR